MPQQIEIPTLMELTPRRRKYYQMTAKTFQLCHTNEQNDKENSWGKIVRKIRWQNVRQKC